MNNQDILDKLLDLLKMIPEGKYLERLRYNSDDETVVAEFSNLPFTRAISVAKDSKYQLVLDVVNNIF